MKPKILFLCLGVLVCVSAGADSLTVQKKIETALEAQIAREPVEELLVSADEMITGLSNESEELMFRGWIQLILATEFLESDTGKARKHFEEAVRLSELSSGKRESAMAHFVSAMSIMQLMDLNGFIYQALNGMKLIWLVNRAYELEPENPYTAWSLALIKDNTDGIFGGSKTRAAELYSQLTRCSKPFLQYQGHLWLSISGEKAGNTEAAEFHKRAMTKLFPRRTHTEGEAL